jgi:hypothetical protein
MTVALFAQISVAAGFNGEKSYKSSLI